MPRLPLHFLLTILTAAFVLIAAPAGAMLDRVTVSTLGGDFALLSAALGNVFSNTTITVEAGTYHECPTVTGLVLLTIVFKKGAVLDASGCDAGLTILDGEGITLKNVTIVGAKQGMVVKPAATRVLITKSTIRDAQTDPALSVLETGVQVEGATDVTLEGVTILGATQHGVRVLTGSGAAIRKSRIADGIGDGVALIVANGAVVEKNVITNLGAFAVSGGGADVRVASNKIFATATGIGVSGANAVVEKNKLTDLVGVGVLAPAGGNGGLYAKNTVVRAATGILAAGTLATFEKNTVKEPTGIGIDVGGDDNVFLGGKVSAAGGFGVGVRLSATGNRFEGTSSAKAVGDGFHVAGPANTFTKAKASGSGGLDLNDDAGAATTNVYTDCKFKTSNLN